jgi:hypothetical protein
MGIHYDYKNTRSEKNMRKKQKRDARRDGKRNNTKIIDHTHPLDKPITLDDLTRPDHKND